MSTQVNFTNQFTALVGGSQILALPVNAARKFLQLANNSLGAAVVRYKVGAPFLVPTNEQQTITFNVAPTGGTWTISYTDQAQPANTTTSGNLAYNANSAAVQTAMDGLVGAGNSVGGSVARCIGSAGRVASARAACGCAATSATVANARCQALQA